MQPIYIVGYMGAGKSTVGLMLARKLGYQFVDTDIFIEARFRRSIRAMFDEIGEARFRLRERMVIEELSGMENCVIATGGGLPCFHDNMSLLNATGQTIYLEASNEALVKRLVLCKRTRPSICNKTDEEIVAFVEEAMLTRRPIYEQAQYRVPVEELVDKADEERVVDGIMALLKKGN